MGKRKHLIVSKSPDYCSSSLSRVDSRRSQVPSTFSSNSEWSSGSTGSSTGTGIENHSGFFHFDPEKRVRWGCDIVYQMTNTPVKGNQPVNHFEDEPLHGQDISVKAKMVNILLLITSLKIVLSLPIDLLDLNMQ